MNWKSLILATAIGSIGFSFSLPVYAETSLESLSRQALSDNTSESAPAIAALRAQGPKGIQAFIKAYSDELRRKPKSNSITWQRYNTALDTICQQRDCNASQLYWYTDFDQAKAAAKATGKPILSLRLLGKLNDEFSCANSRFFRVALYPNAEISKLLRDRYILHWQTVRPAPKLTIDFGDGRKLERTITGNSIHYILDGDGNIIDALPGLYGPQSFLSHLQRGEKIAKEASKLPGKESNDNNGSLTSSLRGSPRQDFLRQYYRDRLTSIQTNWQADLVKLGISAPVGLAPIPPVPTAQQAATAAISKMRVELPIILSISSNQEKLANLTDEKAWSQIAELHQKNASLDSNSQNLMRMKNPKAWDLSKGNIKPGSPQDPMVPVMRKFESSLAFDTVRNEYLLQPKLYGWLIDAPFYDVQSLNEKVYTELFLTPSSDPWLGLLPADAYTAIQNEGVN